MPDQTPTSPRITPDSAARLVAIFAARWGLTGRAAPAVDWTFTVAVVPGLTDPRSRGDAWALVVPQVNPGDEEFPGGHADVKIRDIDATPIPGFDGDPVREIRVTVAHEMGHAVVAEAVAKTGGALTVPAEEQIVETAAQAIVRSEGTPDAGVMARALRAIPEALRARISARAPLARGAGMDPKMIAEALEALIAEGGGDGKCAEILKGIVASLAAKGAGGDGAPAPTDAAPESDPTAAKVEPAPAPGGADGGNVVPAADDARRAKGADMDQDKARARKAAEESEAAAADLKAMAAFSRPAQKEALVVGLRARLGSALKPASEKRIMDAATFVKAKEVADLIEETLGDIGPARARSGVEHQQNAGPEHAGPKMIDPQTLITEGFSASWVNAYQAAGKASLAAADAFLQQGRAVRARRAL